ncbi:hypothetical protein NVV95_16270 [Herbiconiux sp. CPCC 205716]|uniref:Htaa domain-containing protein n=1 Tax=Herbiconiux gentiana TaxID=2970912 RepID=A0ABT2GKH2_9MICO|nr:hypothetical protein [Herbiconiux gentiana]MCS5716102.1 hypothetical protein [Herbiconiux gentiana]
MASRSTVDSTIRRQGRSALRRPLAVTAAAALAAGLALTATTAASAAPSAGTITDASFTWGLSNEAGGGAYFGGCNFLSAGTAGDTGSSRLWTEADGFYSAESGDVSIVKPDASGALVPASWATKCQTPAGTAVSPGSTASLTKNAVVFGGGSGTAAADGSIEISWTGSFTVAFYGGLTYWTATDPVLTLDPSGDGVLTATASGYGTSMEDQSQWVPVAARQIVLADIAGASADDEGFSVTPAYLGVPVTTSGTPQATSGASWGSFPQSFVDFQTATGQASYWYSSGGSRDAAKPASPLAVSYSLEGAVVIPPEEPAADSRDIEVTVPTVVTPEPEDGSFGWSFAGGDAIALGTATQAGSTFVAEGPMTPITVTDTRTGGTSAYQWSISGQVAAFTAGIGGAGGSGGSGFGADALGWTPTVTDSGTGVAAGAAVAPQLQGGPGLGSSGILAASSTAASATIGAELRLVIPSSTPAGDYTSTLTITALS